MTRTWYVLYKFLLLYCWNRKVLQDICLLFAPDETSRMSEFVRDATELLSCPAENFRENLIHRDELSALSIRGRVPIDYIIVFLFSNGITISDQTEVLFRILKELRREKCGFFKSLYAVSDARCPVIRFRAYDKHVGSFFFLQLLEYSRYMSACTFCFSWWNYPWITA